ncbi:hypothetical protein OG978_47220 (plasmid) [Streptomyces sp. NBC_01591]|uniref:hypothetical protein n=1 Tax=Streptomyces sp. NBC_01591 TaxID=2975888 RepID=UPI002DD9BDAA|nr:hypothetical protein [Streptomyces sp. NBC_01591]WSD66032.1 hypothetical protein OG978_00200 [Streptomyces sp. NBC_01591]WSD73087.1 hypothetical protein OG978_40625 [Streptomyces sp. NBC_01591]WSD73639.1 hypothetical protein OG978_41020 [Streptomyces sp. NBC_01591]WSD74574.1 hypothetical protein OG978_47220 [Streptomyces sp. NBC_01591]
MANELRYGDRLHLQNLYQGDGGYLDTNGTSSAPGAKLAVSTAPTATRAPGTGTWEIVSGSCQAAGSPVRSGDIVYLRNLWDGNGGYLDVNGAASAGQQSSGGIYDVTTAWGKDRDENSSRWQIFDTTSAPLDGLVRFNDTVQLWSTYHNRGGFLDTNDVSTATGARYDVDTSAYSNRANADVAFWKVLRPQP